MTCRPNEGHRNNRLRNGIVWGCAVQLKKLVWHQRGVARWHAVLLFWLHGEAKTKTATKQSVKKLANPQRHANELVGISVLSQIPGSCSLVVIVTALMSNYTYVVTVNKTCLPQPPWIQAWDHCRSHCVAALQAIQLCIGVPHTFQTRGCTDVVPTNSHRLQMLVPACFRPVASSYVYITFSPITSTVLLTCTHTSRNKSFTRLPNSICKGLSSLNVPITGMVSVLATVACAQFLATARWSHCVLQLIVFIALSVNHKYFQLMIFLDGNQQGCATFKRMHSSYTNTLFIFILVQHVLNPSLCIHNPKLLPCAPSALSTYCWNTKYFR